MSTSALEDDRVHTPRLTMEEIEGAGRGGLGIGARPAASGSAGRGTGAGAAGSVGSDRPTDPKSPHSSTFPNLRGAAAAASSQTEYEDRRQTIERLYLERDVKLDLNQLPSGATEYANWRFHVEVEILCCGLDLELLGMFVHDMNVADFDDLSHQSGNLPRELKNLDGKLYKTLVRQVRGKDHIDHLSAIRTGTTKACGRQAIRILDKSHLYDAVRKATRATLAIVGTKCSTMSYLVTFVSLFRLELQNLTAAETPLPPNIGLTLLKSAVQDSKDPDVSATLANFKAGALDSQTLPALLDRLEETAVEWKEKNPGKSKGDPTAANAGVKFAGKCRYCDVVGHKESDCRKKKKDEKGGATSKGAAAKKGDKGKGGGGGGGGGKDAGKGAGKDPPCPHCRKTNHTPDRCFFRPGGPGHKGKGAESGNGYAGSGNPGNQVNQVVPGQPIGTLSTPGIQQAPATLEHVLAQLIASKITPGIQPP